MIQTEYGGRPIIEKPQEVELVTMDEIPGRNDEEKITWLIDRVENMSRQRKKWSHGELQIRFPKGKWLSETTFMADNGVMERYFNDHGYEVAQRKYDPNKQYPFDTLERNFSEYDTGGYLVEYSHYGILMSGISIRPGYTRWFDYRTKPDGSKELTHVTTQEFSRMGLYVLPDRLIGTAHCIDFMELLGENYPSIPSEGS